MNQQLVYEVTEAGQREIRAFMVHVSGDAKLILPLFGSGYSLAEVSAKLPPSAIAGFDKAVEKLHTAGLIALQVGAHPAVAKVLTAVSPPIPRQPKSADHFDLDFTGSYPVFTPDSAENIQPEAQASSTEVELEQAIESRSQQLATSKIQQMEQEMDNTITLMVEHALLQSEHEKWDKQQKMVEAARLSPMFESMRKLLFFKDFSEVELAEVLHIAVWAEKAKHEVVLQVGCQTRSFFVMIKGTAAILRSAKLIGVVEAGESFGDGFYLMGEQAIHYASVISTSHVEYLEFLTEPLEAASLEVRYQFARALARSQTRRFRRANEQLLNLLTEKSHE